MRTKVTLVLVFLNVALFFFIFKFERNWQTEAASMEARRRVLGPEAADIRQLEVTTSNHTQDFGLRRARDAWFLTKPLDWPANPYTANSIVTALQLLEHEASFSAADLAKNKQSLADYGLDKPKMTVTFSSGDPASSGGNVRKTTLQIGDATRDGKRVYLLSPDGDRVHVVSRNKIDTLSSPIEQLRADTLFTIKVFEARSLVVTAAAAGGTEAARSAIGLRVRIRREPAGNRWRLETPINAPASRTAVELAINDLNALHAKSFPRANTGPAPSTAAAVRITIEGNRSAETLFLGEPVPDAKAPPGSTEYFAQLEGRNALFTVVVPNRLLELLRNAQETLREKRILDFDPSTVTAVTLSAPLLPNVSALTLQRLEPAAGQIREGSAWQLVRRAEGAQGPQTIPADPAAVQKLLDRLSLLSADKFKSDAPTNVDLDEWGFNRPAREIALTLAGSTTPVVLRLGTDTSRTVYARVGSASDAGTSVYTVASEILDEIPLSPLAWRDRTVGEPLPAAAKITAVKLIDLEGKKTLFETTLAASGEWSPPPADPQALQTLLASLRSLRAKEFVPGGFTERVATGTDDRPWRYQLEATVALPGDTTPAQTTSLSLVFSDRIGGNQQFAGAKALNVVFALEQPMIDALWSLAYGSRDPGPRMEKK